MIASVSCERWVCLQLKVGSHRFAVGHLAYYVNWIDYPDNRNTVIAGVVGGVGGLILLIVIVVIVVLCVRRRKRRKHQRQGSTNNGNVYISPRGIVVFSYY